MVFLLALWSLLMRNALISPAGSADITGSMANAVVADIVAMMLLLLVLLLAVADVIALVDVVAASIACS